MKTVVAFLGVSLVLGLAAPVQAQALKLEAVNGADLHTKAEKGISPAMIKAQVLLDRARFSPGVIDGRDGDPVQSLAQQNPLDRPGSCADGLTAVAAV